jgi:hypothetical protein
MLNSSNHSLSPLAESQEENLPFGGGAGLLYSPPRKEGTAMSVLDDIFNFGSPNGNAMVDLAMATDELANGNLVTYTEGQLTYQPAQPVKLPGRGGQLGGPLVELPPTFSSGTSKIKEYFSDRRKSKRISMPFSVTSPRC